jgi:hypothetical protein
VRLGRSFGHRLLPCLRGDWFVNLNFNGGLFPEHRRRGNGTRGRSGGKG